MFLCFLGGFQLKVHFSNYILTSNDRPDYFWLIDGQQTGNLGVTHMSSQ
jgi:hypothetical protein